jgi:serine protease Do
MNKIIFAVMPWLFAAIGYKAMSQEIPKAPEPPTETQEIIIQKKGDKDASFKIEFKDDKVLINGKPLVEFKDDEIIINNRKIKFKQLEKDFDRGMEDFGRQMELAFRGKDFKGGMMPTEGGTFLGVISEKDEAGAKIREVIKSSAAEKAGLKKDDIITKIDDKMVSGPGELADIIGQMESDKEVKIHYKRAGKDKTTKAVLQERKEEEIKSFSFTTPDGDMQTFAMPRVPSAPGVPGTVLPPGNFDWNSDEFKMEGNFNNGPKLGLKIQDLEEGSGVKILDVEEGSAAEKAGLKKEDIIIEIGNAKINNTDEAREQLHENEGKSAYSIGVKRNNADMKFEVKIPKKLKTAHL